jgi:cell division septation protein DedD
MSDRGDHPSDEQPYAWLQRHIEGEDDAPEILYTTAVRVGVDPWRDDVLAGELEALAEERAARLRGRDPDEPGLVLQITDLVEEPDARVRVGVSLARLFAERELRVVLVDADLRFVGLARYLEDSDGDREGFVDALEYGASGPSLLVDSPRAGVRVLPLGSYRPDQSHAFSDDAIRRLVRQLRGACDVVVLLASAWTADGRFQPLLVHSDFVVLAFELDRSLAESLDELRRYLGGLGIPLAALVARVASDPADRAVDVALSGADTSGATVSHSPYSDPRAGDDSSSPAVRRALTALVVVLLAFVGWWGWTEMSGSGDEGPPLSVADFIPASQPEALEVAADTMVTAAADSSVELGAAAETDDPASEGGASSLATEEVGTRAEAEKAQPPAEEIAEEAAPREIPAELLLAVHDGWALHPWSFADSSDAQAALAPLQRQGMHPVVRSTEIKGSTWYRVLVGNFATRSEAWQARDILAERVRTDWVGVVKIP